MRRVRVRGRGEAFLDAAVLRAGHDEIIVDVGGDEVRLGIVRIDGSPVFVLPSGRSVGPAVHRKGDTVEVVCGGENLFVTDTAGYAGRGVGSAQAGKITARMPGRVVKVLVREGDAVEAGAGVVILEAMKMENEVKAMVAGTVRRVFVSEGDIVEGGADLVEIE